MRRLAAAFALNLVSGAAFAQDCLTAPYTVPVSAVQMGIAALVDRLRIAGLAYPSLVAALDARQPQLCVVPVSLDARGYFDLEANVIAIREDLDPAQGLAILIHEARHLDQSVRGLCPSDDLAMAEVARATLALEADASAVLAHVAWEMREAGDGSVWNALAGFERYGDIARVYEAARVDNGPAAPALAAAFAQWYASDWRRERYYVASCSGYLDRVDEAHRLPVHGALDAAFFESLCLMPDGTSYDCAVPETPLR
jgi:hypothetical protein